MEQEADRERERIMKQLSLCPVKPDFISLYLYPYSAVLRTDKKLDSKRRMNNTEFYRRITAICRRLMDECGFQDVPICITEWNLSMSKRNFYNETCGKAAHILQMAAGMDIEIESAAYNELTDQSGIFEDKTDYMFGGWGLMNAYGARKPAYYALMFLSRLEPMLVYKDAWSIITTDGCGTYTILCFNARRLKYSYYMKNENELLPSKIEEAFEDDKGLEISFSLRNADNGFYTVREYRVSPGQGSILREWQRLGMGESLDKGDYEYLKGIAVPMQHRGHIQVTANRMVFRQVLEPNEIRLIRISR